MPFKRSQYTLLTANYTLPIFTYGLKQQLMQAQIIALIFEADYYMDQVYRGHPDYKNLIENILKEGEVAEITSKFLDQLNDPTARAELFAELDTVMQCTNLLDQAKLDTIEDYLNITAISIAIPCLTKLVSLLANEPITDPIYLRLCSEIVRLVNDYPNREKDAAEQTKNAFNLFPLHEVREYLADRIAEFEGYQISGKVNNYLRRITKLGMLLYKNNDFEL